MMIVKHLYIYLNSNTSIFIYKQPQQHAKKKTKTQLLFVVKEIVKSLERPKKNQKITFQ